MACTWRIAKLSRNEENSQSPADGSELEVLSSDPLKIKFAHGSIVGSIDNETGKSSKMAHFLATLKSSDRQVLSVFRVVCIFLRELAIDNEEK